MTGDRTPDDTRRWTAAGTAAFAACAAALRAEAWAQPSGLPGWTRGHVVAHVAANADALRNLAHWAATGERTPMYASPEVRAEGIALGGRLAPGELLQWLRRSAEQLDAALAAVDDGARWQHEVVTAQGRVVPATEIPWLRAREVWVHAVDLSGGTSFTDLPADLLAALRVDITARRGTVPAVTGPPAEVVAYLAGRPARGVRDAAGGPAPELGPWL